MERLGGLSLKATSIHAGAVVAGATETVMCSNCSYFPSHHFFLLSRFKREYERATQFLKCEYVRHCSVYEGVYVPKPRAVQMGRLAQARAGHGGLCRAGLWTEMPIQVRHADLSGRVVPVQVLLLARAGPIVVASSPPPASSSAPAVPCNAWLRVSC